MAKTTITANGTSKVRFIMLEADGDIREITQAITQALRPAQPLARPHAAIAARSTATPSEVTSETAGDETDTETGESQHEDSNGASRPRAARKYVTPKVLPDFEVTSGEIPFDKFAHEKGNPSSNAKRYLLAAYWCKKYRGLDGITMNHVYTCYKLMNWPTKSPDFSQPLRDLGRNNTNGEFKDGLFTINHIGESAVLKMTAEK